MEFNCNKKNEQLSDKDKYLKLFKKL